MDENKNIKINKNFEWDEVRYGDILIIADGPEVESYMAIQDTSGSWVDLMYLTREECEYMPAGRSYSCYSSCVCDLYSDADVLDITLDRKVDRDDAVEYAYDKGFKPLKTMTKAEIESLLGYRVRIIQD